MRALPGPIRYEDIPIGSVGMGDLGGSITAPRIRDGHMLPGRPQTKQRSAAEIRAIQQFLRNQGYNIPINGKWAGYTASAVANWHKGKGKRNPGMWNKAVGLAAEPAKGTDVGTPPGGGGNTNTDTPTWAQGDFNLNVGNPNVGRYLDVNLAQGGARLLPKSYADQLAGLEYDPQIRTVETQQGRQVRDRDQALHDIGKWYGQVQGSFDTARTRDKAAGEAARGGLTSAIQSIISSLGGSANAASGVVGAAGASEVGTLGAMDAAQQQYLSDLAPLLESEKAGALSGERARQSALAQDLSLQLANLQGQRGAAKGKYGLDIDMNNNQVRDNRLDRILNIQQYNNSIDQQQFTNRLSTEQARVAGLLSGAQASSYDTAGAGGFTPWAELDPSQKQQLIAAAVGNSINDTGALLGTTKSAWRLARNYLLGQGYTGINSKGTAVRRQMEQMIQAAVMRALRVRAEQEALRKAQTG